MIVHVLIILIVIKALDIMMSEEGIMLRKRLHDNVQHFRDGIVGTGFKTHDVRGWPLNK